MRSFLPHLLIAASTTLLGASASNVLGAEAEAKEVRDMELQFFENKIRPVLVEHCYQCHSESAEKVRGGLLLDSASSSREGGDSGPAVVPGKPGESLLLDAIRHETFEMPPSGKLADTVVADFETWIAQGAVDPRTAATSRQVQPTIDIEAGKEFWCFRPLSFSPPKLQNRDWCESTIDRHLMARMEDAGLEPVADADRVTLVRRAYYALIGLPPTPDEVRHFADDESPTPIAFANMVDELLESKHFGERWGRHWLDVVRFAESSGGGRTLLFPDAWRYRDYVIDAFNDDMPYDEFLREQIAGDLLETDDWRLRRRRLTATSFLVLGPTNYELQDKDILEMDIVDEQIDTIGKAFLGMTIGCARCHDHKFDPIPTEDYYALAGILKSTKSVIHSNVSTWNTMALPVEPEQETALAKHEAELADMNRELKSIKDELESLEGDKDSPVSLTSIAGIVVDDAVAEKRGDWKGSTFNKRYVGEGYIHSGDQSDDLSVIYRPSLPKPGRYEARISYTAGSNRSTRVPIQIWHADGETTVYVNQQKKPSIDGLFESLGVFLFSPGATKLTISNADAASGVVIADAVQLIEETQLDEVSEADEEAATQDARRSELVQTVKELEAKIKSANESGPKRPIAMAAVDEEETKDIHLAIRGMAHNKGPIVPRGVLQVASREEFPRISQQTSGRRELAEWIVSPENPLTARMIVNRVWYWLFGEGLVRTVDNFGSMGEAPSHPDLLDHLAEEFIRDGWSIKRLIRRIMLSHVYRLDSSPQHRNAEIDPANRLLWRMNRLRLDAESIRDSLLYVSGNLDLHSGGPNIKPGTKIEYDYEFDSPRRSVYLPVFRNTLPPIFGTFDFADPNIQSGKRTTSTIATQALLLMNHPFVIEQSRDAAKTLLAKIEQVDRPSFASEHVEYCYLQVLGREPTPTELDLSAQFVGDGSDTQQWSLLYQTLFQSIQFRYVE